MRSSQLPTLFPPMPDSGLRSVFTSTRWHVVCGGPLHRFRRPGWPHQTWAGRLSFTGSLMDRARRA